MFGILQGFNALFLPAYQPPKDEKLRPKGSEIRTKFGQACLWWPRTKFGGYSLSTEELEPYRLLGDGPIDCILDLYEQEGNPVGPGEDLLVRCEKAKQKHKATTTTTTAEQALLEFLKYHEELPLWVDVDQLRRGQEVFLAYIPVASLSLYYRSLVAGFSIPKIAAVVRSTRYLTPPSRPDQVLARLMDTGALTASCMGLGIESLLPGGIGWEITLHVRVLHAKVRRALLKGGKWDTRQYGIPINQEDLSATLLAFSTNVLFGIDFVSGVSLSKQEKLDYLALWRYIGWVLGVETETYDLKMLPRVSSTSSNGTQQQPHLSDSSWERLPPLDPCGPGRGHIPDPIANSNSLLQSFIFHLLDPDESSVEVAHHLLQITDRKPPNSNFKKIPPSFYKNELFYFRAFQCRRFIGNPLADALHLPYHPSLFVRIKLWCKSTFFLSLLRVYTLTAMWIPFCRRRMISWHEKRMKTFYEGWEKTHKTRMANALAKKERPGWTTTTTGSEKNDNNTLKAMDADHHHEMSSSSLCPFAMVAPPTTG